MPETAASEPPPLQRSKTPTFEIGDIVTADDETTPLTITEKRRGNQYYATYKDKDGEERGRFVFNFQLSKVGGKSRRRRTRKRIR